MRDLYIDFDGVIKDTIKVSYRMMEDLGIKLSDRERVIKFYKEIDWNYLLNISEEINKAYYYINVIQKEKVFNPKILTTVNSLEEIKAKLNDIRKHCKEVSVISSPCGISKSFIVNPKNSILVDDYKGNLYSWEKEGGIGIKFDNTISSEFTTINTLEEFTKKELCKTMLLRRN